MTKTLIRKRKTEYQPKYSVTTKKALRSLKNNKSIGNLLATFEVLGAELMRRHSK